MVAALVGTGPLAYFVLCNQLARPIPALLVAGGNFMFPAVGAGGAPPGDGEDAERDVGSLF